MPTVDLPRLRATLGQPALIRLLQRLQRRLQRGQALDGSLTLNRATPTERAAVDALLGRPPTQGASLSIDLNLLGELFAASLIAPDLRVAVEALLGPVPNQRAASARSQQEWTELWHESHLQFAAWPTLCDWLDQLATQGTLKRLADSDVRQAKFLLAETARLATVLPAQGEPLASLAARIFGDAHALDPGAPRATLAVRAAARLGDIEFDDTAEGRRMAWASVGVACDELSTPVLTLNLPSSLNTPLGQLLRISGTTGEPAYVTLRALLRWPLTRDPELCGRTVFACENPTIVALANERLGRHCAPLICVNGQFATPVLVMLRQLHAAGAKVCYHGDFDAAGLAIARRVLTESGGSPWRMAVSDYERAPPGPPLITGANLASPWSPDLASAMHRRGYAVHEEAVADSLLPDLAVRYSSA